MSKAVPARLKFPTPVSRLDHLQKWLAAIGSKIKVRWHKHSCDLYVFEGGHRNHKSNFDEARIFLSGVDEGRRDYAGQLKEMEAVLRDASNELEQIVWTSNNDERHVYPDPCQMCETLDKTYAVVEKMRATIEGKDATAQAQTS